MGLLNHIMGLVAPLNADAPEAPVPAEPARQEPAPAAEPTKGGATAVAEAPAKKSPSDPKVDKLPPFKVLLHNDDHNDMAYVTVAVVMIAGVRPERAFEIMMEAHDKGVGLVCVTHKELAELKRDQLLSKGLTASIEAA
jgi:ATP-dependent Clp protease adaptor protein ClpS